MPYRVAGQTTVTRAFSALVRLADPDFDKDRAKEPEYVFHGWHQDRTFRSNVAKRWPYQDND